MSIDRVLRRHQKKHVTNRIDEPLPTPKEWSSESLKKSIDTYLLLRNKPTNKKIDGFHPSYHETCPRWWYLMFKGVKVSPKTPARNYRIFDVGHWMHERYYKYFKQMGILIDNEVPIKIDGEVPIVGTADAIINWGGPRLVELKSISPEGFQFRKVYKKPKDEHAQQAQVYMKALNLDKGFIIYEEKGSQEILIFEISRDDEIYEKRVKQWKKIYKYIQGGRLPKRPYARDSQHCSSCDLEKLCWEELPDEEGD